MRALAAFCLAVLTLAGCSKLSIPTEDAPSSIGNFAEGYLLEPGNRVRIIVFNEQNLSGEFQIDTSGNLSMPLIGTVPAAGVTAPTLVKRVEDVLTRSNYMRNPKVAVEILTYRPFYVLGEVKQPGEYSYTVGMTVLSAVARAGGYDYRAREGEVILVRIVDGLERQYRGLERTPILPGDIIRVTERYF
ncbi:polysaccharide biosynthesis/export family protein [Magnetospirillum sp. 64-120]|uniref:polysaccharide biosynthesis/export family protein n=1 Tax=Magnetospirillum sp. 64-120 TaxID=1895778 RepID=UPI0009280D4C|nr:polysaccharide biosynthesis/export family protein [Magnetospirillum sp. 64-120]OJX67157.1 MAG: sugar ABC transporter substrate-binding protein [Magnetospirillum sp. 64-120]